jgi:hypothetical protein
MGMMPTVRKLKRAPMPVRCERCGMLTRVVYLYWPAVDWWKMGAEQVCEACAAFVVLA